MRFGRDFGDPRVGGIINGESPRILWARNGLRVDNCLADLKKSIRVEQKGRCELSVLRW